MALAHAPAWELVSEGYLHRGQTLRLIDYQGTVVPSVEATVGNDALAWRGSEYSPSALAADRLKDAGYAANSVRGPAHWVTENGETILALWQRYLSNRLE